MLLDALLPDDAASSAAADAWALIEALYPLCRSLTGDGVRQTLDRIGERIPLIRTEVPSGTPAYDWEIPHEWNIRDAWIADVGPGGNGRRVVDFRAHNLHVMGYSVPVRRTMTLDELQPHLHSLPDRPDWIPYRTSYYREQWGFCLRHRDRERLGPGPYEVVIDADLAPGHLSYAESVIPGESTDEVLVYTHTCHPSLANDNLSGIAVAVELARALHQAPTKPRLTWRFIFGPGTIGSLAWLSRNEERLGRVRAGLVLGLLGDPGVLHYKHSRRGDTLTDRAAAHVLRGTDAHAQAKLLDFEPYGYDERQFCSPGFDLPMGRLTRSPNSTYAEYHTSADDLTLIRPAQLAAALQTLARLASILDANRTPLNLSPKGEPRLGKRGLYGSVGGGAPGAFEHALLWVLNQADGTRDLLAIAERARLPFEQVEQAASALERAGLLRTLERTEAAPDSESRKKGPPP
jgi:aminopeptidase-like protein